MFRTGTGRCVQSAGRQLMAVHVYLEIGDFFCLSFKLNLYSAGCFEKDILGRIFEGNREQ